MPTNSLWIKSTFAGLALSALFLTRPTAPQFYKQVWIPALDGMKAELEERREQSPIYKAFRTLKFQGVGLALILEAGKDAELNQLPDFWMEHTSIHDWKLATYFRYEEKDCFSDYLGIAGTLINLGDECQVEPYRVKGGS